MTDRAATPDTYFDAMWATGDDPWAHATRWYEARKYGLTVAALPRRRYRRSFEPGCGTGVLTRALGERSDEHLAMERHPRGVAATRDRCAGVPTVRVVQGRIPDDWPDGDHDLVVLSEVLYYLTADELDAVLDRCATSLRPGGDLVAVHYRGIVAEHTWSGDEVHERLDRRFGGDWEPMGHLVDPDFLLAAHRRPGAAG